MKVLMKSNRTSIRDISNVIDSTKINGLDKADQYTWTQDPVSGLWYKTSNDYWTANNPDLLDSYPSIVAYWAGEDLTDSVGSHTLTNVGTTTFTSGKYNDAFTLNGTSQYLTATSSDDYNFGSDNFTVAFWIYPKSFSATSAILFRGNYASASGWFSQMSTSGTIMFRRKISSGSEGPTSSALTLNQWNHFCVVREGTGTADVKIYLNGSLDVSGQIQAITNTTEVLSIGYSGTAWNTDLYFNGMIDEIQIHNEALTSTEVSALYNSGTGAFLK